MTKEEQDKAAADNILIAKFMGYTIEKRHFQYKSYNSSNEYYWADDEGDVVVLDNMIVEDYEGEPVMSFEALAFHEWDTLMPVVAKIIDTTKHETYPLMLRMCTPNIDRMYRTVVEFINWHNGK